MKLMTVQEYAKLKEISPQAVYSLIKRERVKVEIKDGLKMIVTNTKEKNNIDTNNCKDKIKIFKQKLNLKNKHIKLLEEQIIYMQDINKNTAQSFQQIIEYLKDKSTPGASQIEAEIIESKKKKKKKKK